MCLKGVKHESQSSWLLNCLADYNGNPLGFQRYPYHTFIFNNDLDHLKTAFGIFNALSNKEGETGFKIY